MWGRAGASPDPAHRRESAGGRTRPRGRAPSPPARLRGAAWSRAEATCSRAPGRGLRSRRAGARPVPRSARRCPCGRRAGHAARACRSSPAGRRGRAGPAVRRCGGPPRGAVETSSRLAGSGSGVGR
jgi:hypothetical protein